MRWGYAFSCSVIRGLSKLVFGLAIKGRERIPKQGNLIIAANHCSYFDPPLLGACLPREVNFIAKASLFKNPLFARLICYFNAVPIARSIKDKNVLQQIVELLQNGGAVVIFPEGGRNRRNRRLAAQSGVGFLAAQTGAPVLPVYLAGTEHIEHSVLRRGRLRVVFGEPFYFQEQVAAEEPFSENCKAFTALVMRRIAELKAQMTEDEGSH